MFIFRLKKYLQFEFFPFWVFYTAMIPFWIWFSLKSKSLAYFCIVNPKIKWGGFTQYSKYAIMKNISKEFVPDSQFVSKFSNELLNIDFPFIAKPDIGERGAGVSVIENEVEWVEYQKKSKCNDIIIQEKINLAEEYGVFYIKYPSKLKGDIISITNKEFLTLKGNGSLSIKDFILSNQRAFYRKEYLLNKFKDQLDYIPKINENITLEPIGNHNRGTYFKDGSGIKTKKLVQVFDDIANQIGDFYFGRFDVKAQSESDFKEGKFIILEVNGANSEPTHIYDKKYNVFSAYKEVIRHLIIQQKIATEVHKLGFKYPSFREFIKVVVPRFLGLKNY